MVRRQAARCKHKWIRVTPQRQLALPAMDLGVPGAAESPASPCAREGQLTVLDADVGKRLAQDALGWGCRRRLRGRRPPPSGGGRAAASTRGERQHAMPVAHRVLLSPGGAERPDEARRTKQERGEARGAPGIAKSMLRRGHRAG